MFLYIFPGFESRYQYGLETKNLDLNLLLLYSKDMFFINRFARDKEGWPWMKNHEPIDLSACFFLVIFCSAILYSHCSTITELFLVFPCFFFIFSLPGFYWSLWWFAVQGKGLVLKKSCRTKIQGHRLIAGLC